MVIPFRNESLMPKALDNETPIRGGSVGINEVLGYFINTAQTAKKPEWKVYLLNAYTIARNVYQPTEKYHEFIERFIEDCKLFQEYLQSYLSYTDRNTDRSYKYLTVLYFPKYNLPKHLQKQHPPSYKRFIEFYEKLRMRHATENVETSSDYIKFITASVGNNRLPFHDLVTLLKREMRKNDVMFDLTDPIFLFTNCALDLYIYRELPKVVLMESYTAHRKTFKDFGTKFNVKVPVPFLWEVHRLFGDSTHVEAYVKGKTKTAMANVAVDNKWILKNSNTILNDIVSVLNAKRADFQFKL